MVFSIAMQAFVPASTLNTHSTVTYRIRAYNTSLLIKPPLQPNLNKPPLFCPKSPLFKAFWGKNPKNFNKTPPKNLQIFINRRRTIGADTYSIDGEKTTHIRVNFNLTLKCVNISSLYWKRKLLIFRLFLEIFF